MCRKTQILRLLFVLVFVTLAACTPQPTGPNTVTHPPADSAAPSTETTACTGPVEIKAVGGMFSYKNVHFQVDPSLGFEFTVQECQAGYEEGEWGPLYPAHLLFRSDPPLPENMHRPEIRVFEIPEDPQSYTYPLNSLEELKKILDERPEPSPWYQPAVLHAGEKYLDTSHGAGVRGMVAYHQERFFWTNQTNQYIYNGLSDNGRSFVFVTLPLYAPFLLDIQGPDPLKNTNPEAIPIPNWPGGLEQKLKVIDDYNQEAVRRFETTAPADFTPDLELYDALVQSLQIGE